jgi:hypothetical protein
MSKRETVIVEGVVFYANVLKPNPRTEKYSVDLVVDDETATKLEGLGLKSAIRRDGSAVKHGELSGKVFRITQKTMTSDGRAMTPPLVVDSQNNPVTEIIGNGSKIRVKANVYEWAFQGKKGVAAGLSAVQVVDLIPYTGGTAFEKVEDGFVTSGTIETQNEDFDTSDPY